MHRYRAASVPNVSADGSVIGYDDDPAIFEAELRRREAALGSGHPGVAESASNLAILYNQVSAWTLCNQVSACPRARHSSWPCILLHPLPHLAVHEVRRDGWQGVKPGYESYPGTELPPPLHNVFLFGAALK